MTPTRPTPAFLKTVLFLDAAASGAVAVALVALATTLEPVLGLPAALLRWAGLVLIPFVAGLAVLATRRSPDRGAVGAVVIGNALWVAASVVLLLSGWVNPTMLGTAFVLAQAAAVAVFAALQARAFRRPSLAPAA